MSDSPVEQMPEQPSILGEYKWATFLQVDASDQSISATNVLSWAMFLYQNVRHEMGEEVSEEESEEGSEEESEGNNEVSNNDQLLCWWFFCTYVFDCFMGVAHQHEIHFFFLK